MLRELYQAISPLLGYCHNTPALAEIGLLVILAFLIGCCCGGVLVGILASRKLRVVVGKILVYLLEDQENHRPAREAGGNNRLEKYLSRA